MEQSKDIIDLTEIYKQLKRRKRSSSSFYRLHLHCPAYGYFLSHAFTNAK